MHRHSKRPVNSAGAAELYAAWLVANPGASGSARVFAAYFDAEQDFRRLSELSSWFLDAAKGLPGAAEQFLRIARLFDIAARTEDAANAYLKAFDEGAPASALLSSFLLSLEMNDLAGMQKSLTQLTGKGGSAELLLGALARLQSGDDASAQATLAGLASQTGEPDLALKAMWIIYERSAARGDDTGQAAVGSRLATRFPAAPEAALVSPPSIAPDQQQVVAMPSPWPDLYSLEQTQPVTQKQSGASGPTTPVAAPVAPPGNELAPVAPAVAAPVAPPGNEPAPVAPPIAAPAGSTGQPAAQPTVATYSVQAGAFQMKENADDLVGELTRHGFVPVVLHETAQGKDRYRVLAATGLNGDDARAVLQKLEQLGYSGYLVAEK